MTGAELVTDLKNIIGPGVEVDDTGLLSWVNESYMYMCDEIMKVVPDFFNKSVETTTVANQQEYQLPSDFSKAIMVNIAYDSSTWQRALPMPNVGFIPTKAMTTSSQGYSEAEPYYYILGNFLGFMPIPTSNGSINNIKMWYAYDPSAITSSTSPVIPTKYHRLIKYGAYANYLDQDDEHVAAEKIRQRFDAKVFTMIEQMEQRQVDEPKMVTVVQNQEMYLNGESL